MTNININFIINIAKLHSVLTRELDGKLGGISFTDFVVLFYLYRAESNKLRRIDLADKVGLTASGITRSLLPMEKTGLISRVADSYDARVSYVLLTDSGSKIYEDAFKMLEEFTDPLLPKSYEKKTENMVNIMIEIGRKLNIN